TVVVQDGDTFSFGHCRDQQVGQGRPPHAPAAHNAAWTPHTPRHTYVTTMLDAGADLRDVQTAARHADPRTMMRYDWARNNLDRHPYYILAARLAPGT